MLSHEKSCSITLFPSCSMECTVWLSSIQNNSNLKWFVTCSNWTKSLSGLYSISIKFRISSGSCHQNCCWDAVSIMSITEQTYDLTCRTGRGRVTARCTWEHRLTLCVSRWVGTLLLPAPSGMDPPGGTAFPAKFFCLFLKISCRILPSACSHTDRQPLSPTPHIV